MTPLPLVTAGSPSGALAASYNTLVVLGGVSAVGFAAGMVGAVALLRRRPLAGDAAAHATLLGVATAFLLTGQRELVVLLGGGLVSAVAALLVLVGIRRLTRTRDDAATAIVIGVSFGAGLAVLQGITARGLPGAGGLEQFLLGHTAALTARDATVLAVVALLAVTLVTLSLKETVLVAFDAAFAAASGWPVAAIDAALVTIVAVMVVAGLPAAGAVLVTALVVIPPVAARQWTDRAGTMLLLAGLMGLFSAIVGVAVSALRPGLATGPLVVLAAAAVCLVSLLAAPERGWFARRWRQAAIARGWARGRILEECLALAGDGPSPFAAADVLARAGGDAAAGRRNARRAWRTLVREAAIEPAVRGAGGDAWRLTAAGRSEAGERRRRIEAWRLALDTGSEVGREGLSLDLPVPGGERP